MPSLILQRKVSGWSCPDRHRDFVAENEAPLQVRAMGGTASTQGDGPVVVEELVVVVDVLLVVELLDELVLVVEVLVVLVVVEVVVVVVVLVVVVFVELDVVVLETVVVEVVELKVVEEVVVVVVVQKSTNGRVVKPMRRSAPLGVTGTTISLISGSCSSMGMSVLI